MFTTCKISLLPTLLAIFRIEDKVEKVIRSYRVPGHTDKEVVFHDILKKIEEGSYNRSGAKAILLSPVYRIAISTAAFLVLIFLLHFFFSAEIIENKTLQANALRLPDHSRVVINANSTVRYPAYWWKREIKLQGSAYFEVQKGKKFIVRTRRGDVSVLGTRFQVAETDRDLLVNCYEGKVLLTSQEHQLIVHAGQSLRLDDNGKVSETSESMDYPATAWFRKSFSHDELSTVTNSLEDFFQIDILIKTSQPKHFTGKLETPDVKTAVQIICRSLDLTYSFQTDEVIIIHEKRGR
ncbi:MAG: FecR family protein [Mangrovibacterium sp.]